jgi:hypothetical protein
MVFSYNLFYGILVNIELSLQHSIKLVERNPCEHQRLNIQLVSVHGPHTGHKLHTEGYKLKKSGWMLFPFNFQFLCVMFFQRVVQY